MPPPPQYIYRHRQHIGHGDYAKHRAIAHPVNQQAGQTAAEADSDTAIIAAKAEAERIRIEAEATAEANRTIAESLNDAILRNKTIEKWDGQLPRVTTGEGSTPMISVPME